MTDNTTPAVSDYFAVVDKYGVVASVAYHDWAALETAEEQDAIDPERGPHAVFHYTAKIVTPAKPTKRKARQTHEEKGPPMTAIPATPKKSIWTMNRRESMLYFMAKAAAWLDAADSGSEDEHDSAYCDMHTAASAYFYRHGCLHPNIRAAQIAKQHNIGGGA